MARIFTLYTVLFFLAFHFQLSGQEKTVTYLEDPSWQAPEKEIDIHHLEAHVTINPYDTLVEGRALFTFSVLREFIDSIVFYAPEFRVSLVRLGKLELGWKNRGDELVVYTGRLNGFDNQYKLEMEYRVRPEYNLFLTGWSEPDIRDRKQVWAHRPHQWLPYYGDRLTVDMFITFDGDYEVCSNGVRQDVKENRDGTKTWHYVMEREHPYFSTALAIGDYAYKSFSSENGVPLEYWYYPDREDHFEPTYRYSEQMFSFFDKEFGFPYPYGLYRNIPVQDYLYGAMETTTSTIFGDYMHVDSAGFDGRNYVNVNAHELAHQWFGNCLSHIRNRDVWLTESFATYYAKMFEREAFGEDYYQEVRLKERADAFEAAKKDRFAVGHGRGGRARWYPKGSLVLDMMRYVMGDEEFKRSIHHYLEKNAFSEVETADFLSAIREATGRPMEWFFDQWIYRGGEPEYQVSWEVLQKPDEGSFARVEIQQVHPQDLLTGLFEMPFDIDIYFEDGSSHRSRHWIRKKTEIIDIPLQTQAVPQFIIFDPGQKVLKKTRFERTFDELASQVIMATDMIDRYDALLALRDFPTDKKHKLLVSVYKNESYHMIKSEALRQLSEEMDAGVIELFNNALRSDDPYLRRGAMESLDNIPEELKPAVEKNLDGRSYINTELALRKLVISFPKEYGRYLEMTKKMTGWRGKNIRMAWLEVAIQNMQREYLFELVSYAGPGNDFETRINAMKLLKKLDYLDRDGAVNLCYSALYWNYKVKNAAVEVIRYFSEQTNKRALLIEAAQDGPWNKSECEKLLKLIGD